MKRGLRRGLRLACALLCLLTVFHLATPALAAAYTAIAPVSVPSLTADDLRSLTTREQHSIRDAQPMLRSTVAVYRYADPNSAVIGQLLGGTQLTVLDTCGDFLQIDCYDMVGYLPADQVTCTDGIYRVKTGFTGSHTGIITARPLGQVILTRSRMYRTATAQEGVPYRMGGTTPSGFDCSGFTQYVYRQHGIDIPRTCEMQLSAGVIIPRESLQCGDLVLFHRTNHPTALVTHVGLYLGDGKLIHAGNGGITVVELDSRYFAEHYLCARRILVTPEAQTPSLTNTLARFFG